MPEEETSVEAVRRELLALGARSFRYQHSDDGHVSFELFALDASNELVILWTVYEDGVFADFALFKSVTPEHFIQNRMDAAIRYLKRDA